MHRTRPLGAAAALLLALGLTACGDDAPSGTATLPDPTGPVGGQTSAGGDDEAGDTASGPGELTFATEDGSIEITGPSENCAGIGGTDFQATFTGDGSEVGVTVTDGVGQVTVTGDASFEGTTTEFTLDDDGTVDIEGTGAPAEGQDEPVVFTVTGECAGNG
ncbi:hypothetical protein [Cellulosimicrobium sp. Marseille-Q8652]